MSWLVDNGEEVRWTVDISGIIQSGPQAPQVMPLSDNREANSRKLIYTKNLKSTSQVCRKSMADFSSAIYLICQILQVFATFQLHFATFLKLDPFLPTLFNITKLLLGRLAS